LSAEIPEEKSVSGDDRAVEVIVEPDADNVISNITRHRESMSSKGVRYYVGVATQIHIEIFRLCGPSAPEVRLDPAADDPSALREIGAFLALLDPELMDCFGNGGDRCGRVTSLTGIEVDYDPVGTLEIFDPGVPGRLRDRNSGNRRHFGVL
jgi:hypothetical protein